MIQQSLKLEQSRHGGRRKGSGRKRVRSKGVAHRVREKVSYRSAQHVNMKYRAAIRNKVCLKILKRAILNARRHGLRVIHYSLKSNHIHFILEAQNNEILTRGLRSLTITFAKGLKKGRVQIERYHLHILRGVRETKNAVHYVVFNQQRHTGLKKAYVDEYSSLGTIKDLGKLAREARMSIMQRKMASLNFLDGPISWILRV